MKLVRRAEWGAPAVSASAGIGSTEGVKVHYLGTPYTSRTHDQCDDYVRSIRASHLANKAENYSDIAYSMLVCEHGYVYEGRGAHHRTGANGSATLNARHYAVCALLGSSGLTEPTDAMLHGIRDAIDYLRREGDAGDDILGHRDGYATSCPGDPLYAWVKRGAPRPAVTESPQPQTPGPTAPEEDAMPQLLNEANSIDVAVGQSWLPLAFADAVLHTGPRRHTTLVHLLFEDDVPDGTVIEGRFYLTDIQGKSPSAYLPTRHHHGSGLQFTCTAEVPQGKHLRFEVRALTPDGSPVKLLHRAASGLYWAAE